MASQLRERCVSRFNQTLSLNQKLEVAFNGNDDYNDYVQYVSSPSHATYHNRIELSISTRTNPNPNSLSGLATLAHLILVSPAAALGSIA